MMVNPVSMSSVRFCSNTPASVDTESILNRPGAFTKPEAASVSEQPAKEKKSGKAGKIILGTLAAIAVTAATLGALTHFKVLQKLGANELANAGFFKKIPHYLATAGEAVTNGVTFCANKVKGLFNRGGTTV